MSDADQKSLFKKSCITQMKTKLQCVTNQGNPKCTQELKDRSPYDKSHLPRLHRKEVMTRKGVCDVITAIENMTINNLF